MPAQATRTARTTGGAAQALAPGSGLAVLLAALLAVLAPHVAQAQAGNAATMGGTVTATVIDPGRLVARKDLRFGNIARPASAGTLTVSPSGVVTPTGSMIAAAAIPQDPDGRGAAEFDVYGTGYRAFVTHVSNTTTISNGASTMQVRTFTGNFGAPRTTLDPSGYFRLKIGATLQVNANQAAGTYAGTFNVSVIYQ